MSSFNCLLGRLRGFCSKSRTPGRDEFAALGRAQAIIEFDLEGRILAANEAFLTTMGYTLDEVVGNHHRMFVGEPYATSPEYADFWRTLRCGEPLTATYKRFGKGGAVVWIRGSYCPVLDQQGKPYKVVKVATDITEQVNQNLKHEAWLRAIDRSQAVIEFQPDGTIVDANDNFLETMGYSLREIQGQHHRLFIDPEYAKEEAYSQFWRTLQDGRYKAAEYKRYGKGNRPVWIQASYNPIIDDEGRVVRVVKFATDTTKAKEASNEATRLSRMIEGMRSNVMLTDRAGVVTYMNPASRRTLASLEHVLPIPAENVLGSSINAFYKPSKGQPEIPLDPDHLPLTSLFRLGEEVLTLEATAIFDGDGAYAGVMVTWEVITEHHRVKEEAQKVAHSVASSATELAATTEQISSSIAGTAQLAVSVSKSASDSIESTKKLQEKTATVSEIIKMIAGLASQTHLLAINASIEAVSAGEAGKGFEVVAEEVRRLAEATTAANQRIEESIGEICGSINEYASATQQIGASIADVSRMASEVSVATEQQTGAMADLSMSAERLNSLAT